MRRTTQIIGFTISDLRGAYDAAVLFVAQRAVVTMERARAIVEAPGTVYVYAVGITPELLAAQVFTATPITVGLGLTVISTTSSKLELSTPEGDTIRLDATQCLPVPASYQDFWDEYVRKEVIRFFLFTGVDTDFLPADFSALDFLV